MESLIQEILNLQPHAALGFHKKTRKILYANSEATRLLILGNWYDEDDNSKLSQGFLDSVEPSFSSSLSVRVQKDVTLDLVFVGRKLPVANAYALFIEDRSEEEKKMEKLIEERNRYQSLIYHAPSAVCLFQWDGKTVKPVIVGNELVKILGIPLETIMKKSINNFFKIVHPDEMFAFSSQVRQALFETKSLKGIYRIYNQELGIYQSVFIEAICLPQQDGSMYIMSSFSNVHAEKEKSRQLDEANAQIELLYENSPSAIFELQYDKNLSISFANEKFYSYLGYNRESFQKLRKNRFLNIVAEDDKEALNEAIRSRIVNHSEVPISLEIRLITAKEETKWVSLSGKVMEDEQSNPFCYFVFLDIDEYKLQSISQAKELNALNALINTLPRGVLRFDATQKIVFANRFALDALDYRSLSGKSLTDIILKKDLKRIDDEKQTARFSFHLLKQDGQSIKAKAYIVKNIDESSSSYLVFEI